MIGYAIKGKVTSIMELGQHAMGLNRGILKLTYLTHLFTKIHDLHDFLRSKPELQYT